MKYYLLLFLLGKLSPGPNFILSSVISLTYGFRKSILAVLGITSGSIIWSFIVYQLIVYDLKYKFFNLKIISIAGAIYLIAITILSSLFRKKLSFKGKNINFNKKKSTKNKYFLIYLIALLNCLLNPEIFVFYILVYNGYYQETESAFSLLIFINIAMTMAFLYFMGICYFVPKFKFYIKKYEKYFIVFSKILLIYISISILKKNLL